MLQMVTTGLAEEPGWLNVAYFVGSCIAFNIVMSWVFNRTGQSLPIPTAAAMIRQ